MWDPDLLYRRGSEHPLPKISPTARRDGELSAAKALLFALVSRGIYTANLEGEGEVYFAYRDGAFEPLAVGDAVIGVKQVKALAEWAYAHPEWAREGARKYDAMFEGKQPVGVGFAAYKMLASSLKRSDSYAALAEAFSSLLIKFYSSKALDFCGYAETIARVVYGTVVKQSIDGVGVIDEGPACVYHALLDVMMSRLIRDAKGERAKALVAFLNGKGLFKRLLPPDEFEDYEF